MFTINTSVLIESNTALGVIISNGNLKFVPLFQINFPRCNNFVKGRHFYNYNTLLNDVEKSILFCIPLAMKQNFNS